MEEAKITAETVPHQCYERRDDPALETADGQ
jgi:hypothetical protein